MFKYRVSLLVLFEHNFTGAHESHSTLNLKDVHKSLKQKQIIPPDCIKNIK